MYLFCPNCANLSKLFLLCKGFSLTIQLLAIDYHAMQKKLSIIIPTYNRKEILLKTLAGIEEQQGVNPAEIEVIIVDDASSDGTEQYILGKKDTFSFSVQYCKQQHQGQGNARNLGMSKASGEIVLFIGDDIIPEPDCLKEHLRVHRKYPEPAIACLGFTTWHPEIKITPFMYFLEHGGPQFNYPQLGKQKTIDSEIGLKEASFWYFYTSNISLKRSLLQGHSFEPVYTSYGWEDIDFGYKLTKDASLRIFYNPAARSAHWHEINADSFEQRMLSIGKNARIFQKRYPEIRVLPQGLKKLIFQIISLAPVAGTFQFLSKIIPSLAWFYFYALSKRYFLKGLKSV